MKGLEFINKLRPVTYKMNTEALDDFIIQDMPDSIKTIHKQGMDFAPSMAIVHSGFIAQEVELAAQQTSFPSSIVSTPTNNNDPYALSYAEFVVPLVKAVQELSKAADSTTTATAKKDSINDAKIQAMQNKIDQLDAIINSCCTMGKSLQQNNSDAQFYEEKNGASTNSKDVELSNKNIVVLDQNVPNPFAEQTTINYFLPDNVVRAQIIFLDQAGKLIKAVDLTEKGKGALN
ncbi:MAG: tail fiber domain-containing protein, partial [Bacteroidetes bacterium]|nr:tail fiber domain-containing protein [Bacteroidota bacterium]